MIHFPATSLDSDPLDLYFRYRVRGDKWGFHLTDVLRDHPFPEPEGVTFVSESIVWFAIARRYRTRYVNEYLGINYPAPASEPRLSSLTVTTARGRLLFHQAVIEDYLDFAHDRPAARSSSRWSTTRATPSSSASGSRLSCGRIGSVGRKVLVLSAVPLGFTLLHPGSAAVRSSLAR